MARRIADERGWTIGREIGWHIRFERQFTGDTRLLVVTEGILTAYLQQDPLLSDVATIVIDEFHERSMHADLGLALAKQAWLARSDLRIVVMSATLDTAPGVGVPRRLPGDRRPGHAASADDRIRDRANRSRRRLTSVLPRTRGNVLCFLPGAREIDRPRSARAAKSPAGTTRNLSRCTARSTRPRRIARWHLMRPSGNLPRRSACAKAGHRRHQHRGDVAHRHWRLGGDRFRTAESRALRCGSRRRRADDRAHHARQRRSARRPRRPARSGIGAAVVGRARSTAPASRSRDSSRRSVGAVAVGPGLGRGARDLRVVRSPVCRTNSDRPCRCSNGSAPSRAAASRKQAG